MRRDMFHMALIMKSLVKVALSIVRGSSAFLASRVLVRNLAKTLMTRPSKSSG
jgi:hypothetical protein